jgi:hypothetical protein
MSVSSAGGLLMIAMTVIAVLAGEGAEFGIPEEFPTEQSAEGGVTIAPRHAFVSFILVYAIPLGTGLVLGLTALWGLLSKPTRQWYRFARAIRDEHRQLREQLAE